MTRSEHQSLLLTYIVINRYLPVIIQFEYTVIGQAMQTCTSVLTITNIAPRKLSTNINKYSVIQ